MPFTDVRTNTGYIAMAYTLGLVSGTSKTAFSPDKAATREQAAVMLMRLYDKCHADAPIRSGILAPGEDEAVLTGCAAAAVAAYKLIYAGEIRLVETTPAEEAAALRAQAEEAGVQPLLYVSGTASSVRGDADTTAALLRQAVRKFARLFILRHIALDFRETGRAVLTDGKWLSFVVEQLLSNALKYTPSGGTVRIYADGETLVIADSGIGIREEDLPRIFEKGFTGYNGRTGQKSTGIGLYLCRRVTEKLGHDLTIVSRPGRGTIARLDLSRRKRTME